MKTIFAITLFLISVFKVSAQTLEINKRVVNPLGWPLVWDIEYDQDSTMWACGASGGLFYKTKISGHFVRFATPPIDSSVINALSVLSSNDIWIAVKDRGLFHYDGSTWTKFGASVGLPEKGWGSIDRDKKGNVWFANDEAGVARNNGSDWYLYDKISSGLGSDYVSDLIVDNNDNVWAGHLKNLMMFNGTTWTSRDLDVEFGYGTWIWSFNRDDSDRLWIATRKGLLVVENGVLKSKKNEFGDRFYQSIAVDKKGVIWAHEVGIGLWRFENNQQRKFTVTDHPYVPLQAWKILVSSNNTKLMIGNLGSFLIEVNDDSFSSTSLFSDPHSFDVYPNPALDRLFVKSDAQIVHYKLYDLSGRLCDEKILDDTEEVIEITFDQKILTSNMLILQLTTKDGMVLNRKVVVK